MDVENRLVTIFSPCLEKTWPRGHGRVKLQEGWRGKALGKSCGKRRWPRFPVAINKVDKPATVFANVLLLLFHPAAIILHRFRCHDERSALQPLLRFTTNIHIASSICLSPLSISLSLFLSVYCVCSLPYAIRDRYCVEIYLSSTRFLIATGTTSFFNESIHTRDQWSEELELIAVSSFR